jgi:hypothetical protein
MFALNRYAVLGGLLAILGIASTGAFADKDEKAEVSGYLAPEMYAMLEEVEIKDGRKSKRWIGPKLNFANYKSVLIDDVVLYPKPEPGPQVSEETLYAVRGYLTEKLREKVGAVLTLSQESGPDVLRMQVAITGVEIKTEGMKAYEVMPVAAIFGGLKAATGTRAMEVRVFVESKLSDSVSGEVVGAAVRELEGKNLKGKKDKLSLEDMKESLDIATDDAHDVTRALQAEDE